MDEVECVVVGAGVVGLAVARELAEAGHEVLVLEAEEAIGTHTSSRNSEVIHAGIYYPRGSLKARLCVEGRRRLYEFCDAHGVTARNCGKLIVATSPGEVGQLAAIKARAEANGVERMRLLSAAEATAQEPALHCFGALESGATGILDSHAYMLALQGEAEEAGAVFVFRSPVLGGRVGAAGHELAVGGEAPMRLGCRLLVNAAGLGAPGLAAALEGMPRDLVPKPYYAKGSYFTLAGRAPFSRLIYPVPVAGGLGVHLTLDLAGAARFGPDVEWVDGIDYRVDLARAAGFYAAVRRYWPDLAEGALQAGYAGIRPKIAPPGAPSPDFCIAGPRTHGIPGLVQMFGIESPGLTASLSLASCVRALLVPA